MKNSENLIAPTTEKRVPRARSNAYFESLRSRLDEILAWEQRIKEAKGKDLQALRKAFRGEFGTTFNVNFMKKLTGESRSLENKDKKNEKPESVIAMKVVEMNDVVAADMQAEEQAAVLNGVSESSVFNEESGKIDADRDVVVQGSVSQAKKVISWEQAIADKISWEQAVADKKEIEKVNIEALINQASSFEDLLASIKENNLSIQGSKELFAPEMLQDVVIKIRSREIPLSFATSKEGFRAKVAELLQSDSNVDDLKKLLEDVKSKLSSESYVIGASTNNLLNERRDQRLKWKERLEQAIYQIEENNKKTQAALTGTGQLEKEEKQLARGLENGEAAKNIDQRLLQWAENSIDSISKEDFFKELERTGWPEPVINEVFEYVQGKRKKIEEDVKVTESEKLGSFSLTGDGYTDYRKLLEVAANDLIETAHYNLDSDLATSEKMLENISLLISEFNKIIFEVETNLDGNPLKDADEFLLQLKSQKKDADSFYSFYLKQHIDSQKKKNEAIEMSKEVLGAIEELGLKLEDLEKMESFTSLSEGGRMLALKNYDQILVDDAIKMTPEKIAQIKQARKDKYQSKFGQKKGAIIAGIRNFFGSGKRQDNAFKQSYEGIKSQEDESNKKLALEAAVKWVANFDISAKLEDGKIKLEFVDGSKLDEDQQGLVDQLNDVANKFARMPQYMSNISATKSHKNKYEKAKLELENKKIELESSLNGKKTTEEIITILSSIDNKVANLQNNLTDKERAEFEKSDSWLMKLLKSNGFEKTSFLVGGGVTKYMIRSKLAEDASGDTINVAGSTASGLATVYTLGVSAAIGALRGWQREKKKIREEDKKIGKQEYRETEEMKNRKEALDELKKVTPDFLKLFKEQKDFQEGETWEDYQDRVIAKWSEEEPESANVYLTRKDQFDKANLAFLKEQKKSFLEFKTEANFVYAKSASQKIEKLVNDIYQLQDQEDISQKDREVLNKKIEMLQVRLEYTQNKIDDGLIALGTSQNRLTHSTELFNILAKANLLVESLEHEYKNLPKKAIDIIGKEFINDDGTINIKAWSQQASLEDLALYRQIKIKNFLDSQDDKVSSERMKQKIKKATIGAISGASFAFIGMKTVGYLMDTEAGDYIKEKLGDAISYGVDQGKSGFAAVASLFGSSEELVESMPKIDEVDVITGATYGANLPPEDLPEFVGPTQEEIGNPEGAEEMLNTATKSFAELKESGALSKVISNEGLKPGQSDSVWRSTREIFLNNAESLGYEGDEADLTKWAETQTNRALANSGEIADKVFEGNRIALEKIGDIFVVSVEQGDGIAPGFLEEANLAEAFTEADTITDATVIEDSSAILSEEAAAETVVTKGGGNVINNPKSLEFSEIAINKWLATVGEKFSLTASEMAYEGNGIIKTIIGGQEIFIDPIKDQYYFFNDLGEEFSGFLVNAQGEVVTNVKEFLADKFGLVSIDNITENLNQFVNKPDDSLIIESIGDSSDASDSLGADVESSLQNVPSTSNLEEVAPVASAEDLLQGNEKPDGLSGDETKGPETSLADNNLEDGAKNWDDLSNLEKQSALKEFFESTEGTVIRARANEIGPLFSSNSNLPLERLSAEALTRISDFTGIDNLAENITDKESQELNKLIGFIVKNGYSQSTHGSKLANFVAKLMFSRGKLSL